MAFEIINLLRSLVWNCKRRWSRWSRLCVCIIVQQWFFGCIRNRFRLWPVLGMNAWNHRSCDHHPWTLLQDRPRNCSSQVLPRLDDSSGCGRAVDCRILYFWHPSIRVVETCTGTVPADDGSNYQSSTSGRHAYCLVWIRPLSLAYSSTTTSYIYLLQNKFWL